MRTAGELSTKLGQYRELIMNDSALQTKAALQMVTNKYRNNVM